MRLPMNVGDAIARLRAKAAKKGIKSKCRLKSRHLHQILLQGEGPKLLGTLHGRGDFDFGNDTKDVERQSTEPLLLFAAAFEDVVRHCNRAAVSTGDGDDVVVVVHRPCEVGTVRILEVNAVTCSFFVEEHFAKAVGIGFCRNERVIDVGHNSLAGANPHTVFLWKDFLDFAAAYSNNSQHEGNSEYFDK